MLVTAWLELIAEAEGVTFSTAEVVLVTAWLELIAEAEGVTF